MIEIDYYLREGSLPTLLIVTKQRAELLPLRKMFADLTSGVATSIELMDLPIVRSETVESFRLVVGPDDLSPFRATHVTFDTTRPAHFVWTEAQEIWLDSAERVDPLIEHDQPGHQYLADGDRYEITVILSHKESQGWVAQGNKRGE